MHTQRLLKIAAASAAVALVAAGCGGSSDSSSGGSGAPAGAAFAGPVADGEGQVNILAWPGYVEDGSTDPAVDWVTDFEKERERQGGERDGLRSAGLLAVRTHAWLAPCLGGEVAG